MRATCTRADTPGSRVTHAGKSGTIVRVHGVFDLQDTDVHGFRFGYRPEHVYTVRFAARELWGDRASERDAVYVDLWESYLERA